jgi:hypothetical protein
MIATAVVDAPLIRSNQVDDGGDIGSLAGSRNGAI